MRQTFTSTKFNKANVSFVATAVDYKGNDYFVMHIQI